MSWLQNRFVLIGSMAAVVWAILWGFAEGGYEPWIVALFGVVGIVSNLHEFASFGRKRRPLTPEEKIKARDKWRPVFQDYFLQIARNNYRSDAIVHDVDRLDTYPETKDEKGISSWFRVGLMGTYHKGILLGIRWTRLIEKGGKWIEEPTSDSPDSVKVMLLGEVPYESIESVNLDGDDFYDRPHIFCHFEHGGEPYQRLFYGEEFQLDPGFPFHYRELAEYPKRASPRWKFWDRAK